MQLSHPPILPVYHPVVPSWQGFLFSTFAPIGAVLFTNPFDTAKVRLQLQTRMQVRVYNNSLDCMTKILKNEGIRGLQQGLTPAIFREGSKNIFRLGLFEPILNLLHDKEKEKTYPPVWKRIVASATSGALGALACNPFELVKTRLQAQTRGSVQTAVGHQHNYSGMMAAFSDIVKKDGIAGLYKGSGISVVRGIFGTSANLSTYSYLRDYILAKNLLPDSPFTDMACSFTSSFVTVLLMNPVDVIRTRVYNQPSNKPPAPSSALSTPTSPSPSTSSPALPKEYYSGGMDCLVKVVRNEGPSALYKGFTTNFLRLGPHFTLTFLFLEQMRRMSLQHSYNQYKKEHDTQLQNLYKVYNGNVTEPRTFERDTLIELLENSMPHTSKTRIEQIVKSQSFTHSDIFEFKDFAGIVQAIES